MIINTNMNALTAYRNMSGSLKKSGSAMEKLSSGFKINRGSDDAAGLSISEKMRAQIKGLDQANSNAQNAVSLLQTAEGSLAETHSMLHRMRQLAIQGATEGNTTEDNTVLDKEFQLLMKEIDRSTETTQFNKKNLIDGTFGNKGTAGATFNGTTGVSGFNFDSLKEGTVKFATAKGTTAGTVKLTVTYTDKDGNAYLDKDGNAITQVVDNIAIPAAGETATINLDKIGMSITVNESFAEDSLNTAATDIVTIARGEASVQVGANANQTISFNMRDMSATGKVLNLKGVNITDTTTSQSAITALDTAISEVSQERANIGAVANRMEYTMNNLSVSSENLTSAESRIRDADIAKEMMTFSKFSILQQASQAMIAQANQQPQGVLQLLR